MGFQRFNIKRDNKNKSDIFYDDLYSVTDAFVNKSEFAPYPEAIIDIKFFINEIAANFIKHDTVFIYAHIDLSLSTSSLDGNITITHDGNDFDPLSEASECDTIKAAANRISFNSRAGAGSENASRKLTMKFNLKSWNKN